MCSSPYGHCSQSHRSIICIVVCMVIAVSLIGVVTHNGDFKIAELWLGLLSDFNRLYPFCI